MKIKKINSTANWLLLFFWTTATAFAQTTSFTYQGRLMDSFIDAEYNRAFVFTLYAGTYDAMLTSQAFCSGWIG